MSPHMKAILLSFNNLRLNTNVPQDLEGLKKEGQKLELSQLEESHQNLASIHNRLCFSPLPERGNKSFKFDNLFSTMAQGQELKTRGLVTAQSKGTQRRPWAVASRILVRSNTVDSLPVQKSDNYCHSLIRCKESLGSQCAAEGTANSAPQSPVLERKTNVTLEKRIKPKSAMVVTNQVSPVFDQKLSLDGIKSRRSGIKPSTVFIRRRTVGLQKGESAWDTLSEERTFLINKWLARPNR